MAKQAEEKAGAKQLQASPKTPQLFDVVSKLREVGRPPVNSLSTIAEEGAASQIYSLPVSNAHVCCVVLYTKYSCMLCVVTLSVV